jgi:hypothetical protein
MGFVDLNTEEGVEKVLDMLTDLVDRTKTPTERFGPLMDQVIENMKKLKTDIEAGRLLNASSAARQYGTGLVSFSIILVREAFRMEVDEQVNPTLADDVPAEEPPRDVPVR